MKKDPAFLFYSKDWLEGTAELKANERGVFINLLAHQHQKGSIPTDIDRLANLGGCSIEEFTQIWVILEPKYKRDGDRLVNRKLLEVMAERSDKGHRNKIIGTFAAVLRLAKLSPVVYNNVRKLFKVDDWLNTDSEHLTERLTEWLRERLKSIGNANENPLLVITPEVDLNNLSEQDRKDQGWKFDYAIYLKQLQVGFTAAESDKEFINRFEQLYPEWHPIRTIRACYEYWKTEEGWNKLKEKGNRKLIITDLILNRSKYSASQYTEAEKRRQK